MDLTKNSTLPLTNDAILGGRLQVLQPKTGYRIAIDPIFLAASIDVKEGESVLDVGTGVGAAALCLAQRAPGCQVTGLELQREIVRIAVQNVDQNNMRQQIEVLQGDLTQPPPRLTPSTFHHVMVNPPFYEAAQGTVSPLIHKQLSNTMPQDKLDLKAWVNFACLMVRPKGSVTFIYPGDRIENLLCLLQGKLGALTLFPLWRGEEEPAKRILVRGTKSVQGPTQLLRGLALHGAEGKFTMEAEAILRHAQALKF